MNAEITPIDKAIPNVLSGGSGEIMLAIKAATVVITAKPSGVDNFAHAANQASELS